MEKAKPYTLREIAALKHGLEIGAISVDIQADPVWGHGVWARLIASYEEERETLEKVLAAWDWYREPEDDGDWRVPGLHLEGVMDEVRQHLKP